MTIEKQFFGQTEDGRIVDLYTLTNSNGVTVQITNYGGIVTSLLVPDKNGKIGDVVLGYDNLDGYLKASPYFGCIVGRYGNRIAKGKFTLNGKTYNLATNNGPNHLHGGVRGFDKVVWQAKPIKSQDAVGLELSYLSPDGEEGYPGNLSVKVTYTLTNENALHIDYEASSDQPTICNLTHHSYFNLKDGGASPILDHELMLNADYFTPVDETLIPTGELRPVDGTPFDFRRPTPIGARINVDDEQIKYGLGYDHNFVLNGNMGELRMVGKLREASTGRVMEIWTTEPGLQFYSGNFLDGSIIGKNGTTYYHRHGLCLETQHFPDSPNHPNFPSTVLNPGEKYQTTTIYKFMVEK
ncbi:MAG: galactose mutarotase [candidate division KSB1 bacterium]|nr:galactose mutarotase [candidate division KSB1 bacterium]MDZ7334135.1 galactose mutarotase [candidate division KSB1 bacterium]MDZ7357383.1 galactose mutarotase [candidate division KSB1 bacterium]MDZ7375346.1 galactose mutarotase [candidate division KSB1 bacterium]MDZ7401369.1 galactose mutarotase [candidate division KSB1 bacterium]